MDYNELRDDAYMITDERILRHREVVRIALDAMNNHPNNCPCKICERWHRKDNPPEEIVPVPDPVPFELGTSRVPWPENVRLYYRSRSVKPDGCPVCGSRLIYFFNKSGEYLADDSDYYWMCRACKAKQEHRATHPAHIHRTVR
jgi:hypothetical protein